MLLKIPSVFSQMAGHAWRNGEGLSGKASYFNTLLKLKLNKAFSKSTNAERSVQILDYKVTGYDYETLHTLFYDIFLLKPYQFTSKIKDPVIIDCGAHIGVAMLFFKKIYPNSSIHSIEANPNAFKCLEKNIDQNRISGISVYNAVLTNEKGKIPFYINQPDSINGSIRKEKGSTELQIESMKLSELIAGIGGKIDLVKIDVEGAEHEIAEDLAAASLLSAPNQYIIEYHHGINGNKSSLADFLKKFEDSGYKYNLWSRSQINQYQDILIHFYKQV